MMDPTYIAELSRRAASKAAAHHLEPIVIWPEDVGNIDAIRAIPNLGDYVPVGWALLKSHFVDSSGFGEAGEAAMPIQQFVDKLVPGHGYALVECGQFQVYVGEFVRDYAKLN